MLPYLGIHDNSVVVYDMDMCAMLCMLRMTDVVCMIWVIWRNKLLITSL